MAQNQVISPRSGWIYAIYGRIFRQIAEVKVEGTAGTFDIALEVRAANVGARWFYRRLGYREDRCIAGYYCRVENAVRMVRDLRVIRGKNAA